MKWGVQPRSFTHCTELFGPVLGVMPARDLHAAIDLVNATGYGLTAGLESLDDREHRLWQEGVRAGNLYVNRPTTGAIVLRQPFGGMGKSAFGPGIKAGGPNYVAALMDFKDDEGFRVQGSVGIDPKRAGSSPTPVTSSSPTPARAEQLAALVDGIAASTIPPVEISHLRAAIDSYLHWADVEFDRAHDHFRLIGEDNFRRYLPIADVRLRLHADDGAFDVLARAAAARAAGCRIVVSSPPGLPETVNRLVELLDASTDSWAGAIEFVEEPDQQLADAIIAGRVQRIRYAAHIRVPEAIRRAAAELFVYIADAPPLACGRIELLWYYQEQSLSHVYHRYGNLGRRADEVRATVL